MPAYLLVVIVLLAGTAMADPKLRIVPQQGHSSGVTVVAISPDGKLVASGSNDKRIKLWDADTGALLATLRGQEQQIVALAFSPDGARLAVGCGQEVTGIDAIRGDARIWDLASGSPLVDFVGHTDRVFATAFSPDGTRVLTGSLDDTARLWDAATGKQLAQLALGEPVYDVMFRDHAQAVVVTKTRVVLVDVATFKPAREHRIEAPIAAVLSGDGARLAVRSLANKVLVIDPQRGSLLHTIAMRGQVGEVQFAPDGKRLHAFDIASTDECQSARCTQVIRTFDVATGTELAAFEINKDVFAARPATYTRDGARVVAVDVKGAMNLWDIERKQLLRSFRGVATFTTGFVQSKDGRRAYAAAAEGVRVWDLANPAVVRVLAGHGRPYDVSGDGKRLLVGRRGKSDGSATDPTIAIIDATTGAEQRTFPSKDYVDAAAFSPDGARIAIAESFGPLRVLRVADGVELSRARLGRFPHVAFSSDGKRIIGFSDDTGALIFDAATGATLTHYKDGRVYAIAPDGRYALAQAWSARRDEIALVDITSGAKVRAVDDARKYLPHSWNTTFSADGKLAVTSGGGFLGAPHWLRVIDTTTGALIRHVPLEETARTIAFSPSSRHVVAQTTDGIFHYIDVKTGAALAMMADGSDWLVWNADGYFDASRSGGELVAAVEGVRGYRIDQLAVRNNRPDLLLASLGIGDADVRAHYRSRFELRARRLGLDPAGLGATFDGAPTATIAEIKLVEANAQIVVDAESHDSALLRYTIHVNGVPALRDGKPLSGSRQRITDTVALVPGRNKIEVSIVDRKGRESMRPFRFVDAPDTPAAGTDLYFIGFGVSRYRNAAYNLGFPHKDVLDVAEALRAMRGTAFRNVHVHAFVDAEATVANVRAARSLVADARPTDTVVLFIAGHGLHAADASADYYFATHEIDVKDLARTAAPFELFEALLQATPARHKLFLMDTCESGERDDDDAGDSSIVGGSRGLVARSTRALVVKQRTARGRSYLFQRDRYIYNDLARRTGAVVLSSSRGVERSYELAALQNGAFTQAILDALVLGTGDRDGDGKVTTAELRDHLALEVPKLTEDRQHPIVDRDNLDARIAFPVVAAANWVATRADPVPAPPPPVLPASPRPRGGCACNSGVSADAAWWLLALCTLLLRRRVYARAPCASVLRFWRQ